MKTVISIFAIFTSYFGIINAQLWTRYNSYTSGLSHNTIYDIGIETNGTKWFATYYGVSKLSGSTWRKYTNSNGLTGNRVYCVTIDKNGTKWFGTDNGLSKYNDTAFTNYTTTNGLLNNNIRDIAIDNQGRKWLATDNGLSVFNDTSFTNYTINEGLPSRYVQCIDIDNNNNIWMGTNYGISVFDGSNFNNINPGAETFFGSSVNSIAIGPDGNIWIGTETGAAKYNGSTWTRYTYKPGELCDNQINKVAIDGVGKIWFATNKGIAMLDGISWINYTTSNGLTDNLVTAIAFEGNNYFWFGFAINGVNKMATPFLSVSDPYIGMGGAQNSKAYFNITSNVYWTISCNESWLSLSQASGSGNAAITINAQENPTSILMRQATITVSATGFPTQTVEVTQAPATPILIVSPDTIELSGFNNSEAFISIQSNGGWKAFYDTAWLSLSEDVSLGSKIIMLRASENTTGLTRTSVIRVNSFGTEPDSIIIKQAAQEPTLFVSPTTLNISYLPNSKAYLTVSSNLNWTASSNQSWVSIEPSFGSNNQQITITAQENPTTTERIATINFTANGVNNKTVTLIQQERPYFNLSAKKIFINSTENSTTTFIINANARYELSWSALWFRLNRSNGNGTDTVTVTAENNYLSIPRIGYIFVEQGGIKDTITLIQAEGPYIELPSNTINIGAEGTSDTKLFITSNTTWNLNSAFNLVTPNKTTGTGSDTITLTVLPNTGTEILIDYITISDTTGIFKTVNIIQACSEPFIYADTTDIYLSKEQNSSATFSISSNRPWTIITDCICYHLSQESGTGNAIITVTADENLINSPVYGNITIYSEGIPKYNIKITQEPANFYLLIQQDTLYMDVNGNNFLLKILSNVEWGISNYANWLTIDKMTGESSDTLKLSGTINYENNRRFGSFMLYSPYFGVDNIPVTIIQDSMYLNIYTDSIIIGHSENNTGTFNIYCNSSWFTYNYSSWLTLSQLSGEMDTTITCTVTENTEETPREEILTFYAGTLTKTIKIIQQGKITTYAKDIKRTYVLHPNPAQNILFIKHPGNKTTITISNSKGNVVLTKTHTNNESQLNIEHLSPGVYFVTINDGKTIKTEKLIKLQ